LFEETSQVMLQEVQRLTALVAHFSEYAKLPSPQLSEVDLSRLLEEVVSLHKQLGATLEIRTEQLPPVRADRNQIAQVLTNLIKNSLEATKEVSQPRVLISLVAQAGHPEVQCLTVTDNGPGVQQEDLERLFEPYVTTKVEGTGLGLPISQRIAVEHGGDLAYRTAEGGGAQFELSLPRFGPPELPDT
jgi:nitrogen fixation/metabolism regulation signal transduction histidine kinase